MNHPTARQVIVEAFRLEKGRDPVAWEAQVVQVVSWLETNYGAGWQKPVKDGIADPEALTSNNWGAIQYGPPPPTPGKSFGTKDTHRDGTPYTYTYRIYPSPVEGARDVVRTLERLKVLGLARAPNCTQWVIAQNMIRSGYAEGSGKTEADAMRAYWKRYKQSTATVTAGLSERPMPEGGGGEEPPFFREPGPDAEHDTDRPGAGPEARAGGADLDLEALQKEVIELKEAQVELAEAIGNMTAQLGLVVTRLEAAVVRAVEIVDRQVVNTTRLDQFEARLATLEHRCALNHPKAAAE